MKKNYAHTIFKAIGVLVFLFALTFHTNAQPYRLIIGNKSDCEIHVRTIFCENEVGPDFYIHAMDQDEIASNVRFQRVEIYTVFPSGEVLTYAVITNWELYPDYFFCGQSYFPILLTNECINKGDYNLDSNGNIQIAVWKE